MDRREFLVGIAAIPLIRLDSLTPSFEPQQLVIPTDLACGLAHQCEFPLEERLVRETVAAKIARLIEKNAGWVFFNATETGKFDYINWSWVQTGKRWKQMEFAKQIAAAGEFTITKRGGHFVVQTSKCILPPFRTSHRRLIVDYDAEMNWPALGYGGPPVVNGNELCVWRPDWQIIVRNVYEHFPMTDVIQDDVLTGDECHNIAQWLRQPEVVERDTGHGFGCRWCDVADWLDQGDCVFVAFPNQPMI